MSSKVPAPMSSKVPAPTMRRAPGQEPHPLLVDRVLYVRAGRDDAETGQRIAKACSEAGIDPARAVACMESPPAGNRGSPGSGRIGGRLQAPRGAPCAGR